jgi:hypothetical protein
MQHIRFIDSHETKVKVRNEMCKVKMNIEKREKYNIYVLVVAREAPVG